MKNLKFVFLLILFSCISLETSNMSQDTEKAYFAGGCFWCMEPPFEALDGVLEATSGYMGGETENPTYEQVSMGNTGHAEVVEIEYDPNIITYSELLEVFWRNIDPTALNYQFADVGSQYRTEIFTVGPNQMEEALNSKDELEKSNKFDKPIVTAITEAPVFYIAEEYHQDFYKKQSARYKIYAEASGRKGFLEDTWGDE
ncbi:peptide-methionine (S)-S-oxide reductase MsrA [Acidimicrobiaceae bacterium]|jgi:methionine-S-sulfoxide reductase|nr:peptide-methionine (S)-S-oxide reductase MsrA [Acidimicrobiaceae bacterium]MDA9712640.1 peptide-methionine (S)-S-oxide reductase MsrA [Acidimicrobiaceae bacterium]